MVPYTILASEPPSRHIVMDLTGDSTVPSPSRTSPTGKAQFLGCIRFNSAATETGKSPVEDAELRLSHPFGDRERMLVQILLADNHLTCRTIAEHWLGSAQGTARESCAKRARPSPGGVSKKGS
ncbi:hypothetical protein CHU98_g10891 [Xylaria longipes]|nr:hypothetical protein CHU98_g10891 [Xylaria longipes]